MKNAAILRLVWWAVLALALFANGPAAALNTQALIQAGCKTQNGASSSSTVACTLASGVLATDLVPLFVAYNTSVSVSGVTDDKSDSCTVGTPVIGSTVDLVPVYCPNLTAGAKTFTATMSGSATLATIIVVGEFSGAPAASALDQTSGNAQTTPGTGSNAITSLATNSLARALAAYWKFDENTGTVINDSASVNTGTFGGTLGSQWITGKINSGLSFNGTNNLVTTTPAYTFTAFSYCVWINPSSITGTHIIVDGAANGFPQLYLSGANVVFAKQGLAIIGTSSGTVSTGSWQHVCATYDGTNLAFYINGASAGTASNAQSFTSGSFVIGSGAGASWFSGGIDEVGAWARVLSSAEITTLYNSGSGNQYPFGSPTGNPYGLVVAATINQTGAAGSGTISTGTGFTPAQTVANTLSSQYEVVTANGGGSAGTFTAGSALDSFATAMMTFNPTAALSNLKSFQVLNGTDERLTNLKAFTVLNGSQEAASKIVDFTVLCAPPGTAACPAVLTGGAAGPLGLMGVGH